MSARESENDRSDAAARAGDSIPLTARQLFTTSFFSHVQDQTVLDGINEGIRLRRVRQGETICRQGEPGWSAMCLLNSSDLENLRVPILDLARRTNSEREALESLEKASSTSDAGGIAVYLAHPRKADPGPLKGVFSWLFSDKSRGADPAILPIDASPHLDYEIRQARIFAGELFGELNCRDGEPRSATLVALKDCYLAEVPGGVIDLLENDPGFREEIDKIYLKRGFEHELLSLAIFEDLEPAQIERVKEGVELVRCRPGEIIFQENDLSDAIYIIRGGMVQTVKRFTDLVGLGDIPDWKALLEKLQLLRAAGAPDSWRAVADRIDWTTREPLDPFQEAVSDPADMTTAEKQEWIHKLNDFLKEPLGDDENSLPEPPPGLTTQDLWPQTVAGIKSNPPDTQPEIATAVRAWSAREKSCFGRNWFEALVGQAIMPRQGMGDAVQVLSYMAKGEYFGEMGVLADQPRSATCIAFAAPISDAKATAQAGEVAKPERKKRDPFIELVKIPGDLFLEILADAPALRRKVDHKVAKRNQNDLLLLGSGKSDQAATH